MSLRLALFTFLLLFPVVLCRPAVRALDATDHRLSGRNNQVTRDMVSAKKTLFLEKLYKGGPSKVMDDKMELGITGSSVCTVKQVSSLVHCACHVTRAQQPRRLRAQCPKGANESSCGQWTWSGGVELGRVATSVKNMIAACKRMDKHDILAVSRMNSCSGRLCHLNQFLPLLKQLNNILGDIFGPSIKSRMIVTDKAVREKLRFKRLRQYNRL